MGRSGDTAVDSLAERSRVSCEDPPVGALGRCSRLRLLVDALAMRAADPDVPRAWVAAQGVAVDELALDFDHALRMVVAGLVAEGLLGDEAAVMLESMDTLLTDMSTSGDSMRREPGSLATDPGWEQARTTARNTLDAIRGAWHGPLPETAVTR